jgi:sulfite reductase beta subunit-like hemoprotein
MAQRSNIGPTLQATYRSTQLRKMHSKQASQRAAQTRDNGEMEKDKILEQLVAIVAELRELCAVIRQNAVLTKNNGLLLKRQSARMNALLLQQGIESLPDVVEENALLVEQNVILIEQRECDIKSLMRLQQKLDAMHAGHAELARKTTAG